MIYMTDEYGRLVAMEAGVNLDAMSHPMRCKWCHKIHDAGNVEVVQRYMDCTVWKCPNCGRNIDDRHPDWGGSAIPVRSI